MKNLILIAGLIVGLVVSSCEDYDWPSPDVEMTQIYSIVNIQGKNAPYQLDIYRKSPIMIEFVNKKRLMKYNISEYEDLSTDTEYLIKLTREEVRTDVSGKDSLVYTKYEVSANKETNTGELSVIKTDAEETSVTTEFSMTLEEVEKYR